MDIVGDLLFQDLFLIENSIKFSNSRIFEDEEFIAKLFLNTQKFYFSKIKFYFHYENLGSLSDSSDYKDIRTINVILKNLDNLFKIKGITFEKKKIILSRIHIIFSHFESLLHLTKDSHLNKISKDFHKKFSKNKIIF